MTPPDKFSKRQDKFLELLVEGHTITSAAKTANIGRKTIYDWRYVFPEFRGKMDDALMQQVSVVEDALYKKALRGNVTAQIFYLCNRGGGRWQHVAKIEHHVIPHGTIHRNPDLKRLSSDQLRSLDSMAASASDEDGPNIIESTAKVLPYEGDNGTNGKHNHNGNGSNGTNGTGGNGSATAAE